MKILITGASGFVGANLAARLRAAGHEIFKLTRSESKAPDEIHWFGEKGIEASASAKLENFDAVVHLAGEPIAEGSWTTSKKQRIRDSRVTGTRNLVSALKTLKNPPRVFVSASAIGFYGNRGDEILDEESRAGEGFLSEICLAWESEAKKAEAFSRLVSFRIGVVLDKNGGALQKMLVPFQFGVGGRIGNGKQWMSWIALLDLLRMIEFALNRDDVKGIYNATAPTPVTNEEFTKTLGEVLRRPTYFPVPEFAVKLMFGEMGETLLLGGARVLPKRILDVGFQFEYANLKPALEEILK